jgi:hypothetical protein
MFGSALEGINSMKIKAVQLDLARQKENLDFIFSFIEFVKQNGFNTLLLYLEGIVKTKSFSRVGGRDTYEPEDIRRIVSYATKNGLDVIPVVSSLGHAEMFLEHPDHAGMAELQGDTNGRWPTNYHEMTCPSSDQTYEFFERYFAEVAELFPGEYFHTSLDETWQLGMCDDCKKRFEQDGKTDLIYADHVRRVHAILKKLGKTMMMWDDMFEVCPEVLDNIPTDIVMCSWYYNPFADRPVGHFVNYVRRDVFKEFDQRGFKYLFCPRELSASNVLSFTNYASKYQPIGGIVTAWEKSFAFYAENYPVIAFAGKLWDSPNADAEKLLEECISETTGAHDPLALTALKTYYHQRSALYNLSGDFAAGEVTPLEEEQNRNLELIYAVIAGSADVQNPVIEDVCVCLRERILDFKVRKAVYENILAKISGGAEVDFVPLMGERKQLRQLRLSQWSTFRDGISNEPIVKTYDNREKNLSQLLEKIDDADHYLFVRFFLPDAWSASWASLIVVSDQGEKVSALTRGILKAPLSDNAYYEYIFPIKMAGKPETIAIEIAGYGGQGVSFVKLFDRSGKRFVPACIRVVQGQVHQPGDVLADDLRWCYLGEREVMQGFRSSNFGNVVNRLELGLSPEK